MNRTPAEVHAPELDLEQRTERDHLHQEALEWLRTNKDKYAGQWVALHGSRLLAVGATAKEMYSRIGEGIASPLVARIEDKALPFAGW